MSRDGIWYNEEKGTMKRLIALIISGVLLISAVFCLTAFVFIEPILPETYTGNIAVYNLSGECDVEIQLTTPSGDVSLVQLDGIDIDDYKYDDSTLIIPKKTVQERKFDAGEYAIKIYYNDSQYVTRTLFVATRVIKTCQEFQDIGTSSGTMGGAYILGCDLDFADFGNFEPLGMYYEEGYRKNVTFTGIFEGNGYTIKNISIKSSECKEAIHKADFYLGYGSNLGVFSYISDIGIVRNLTLQDCKVETDSLIAGVLAGNNAGTISNCIVKGGGVKSTMTFQSGWLDFNCFLGGFVGINGGTGTISNCICAVDGIEAINYDTIRYFCGKCWGTIVDSVCSKDDIFTKDIIKAYTQEEINDIESEYHNFQSIDLRDYHDRFTYTALEPGDSGYMGTVEDCYVDNLWDMTQNNIAYESFDRNIWEFADNKLPSVRRAITVVE